MKPIAPFSMTVAIVAVLRFLPSEAGEVSASYADGGVMSILHDAHDSSARFAGTSPSRDSRGGGTTSARLAQSGRGDGGAARSDALMGTPNRKTPVPQDNLFSTSPRLEQQAPKAETGPKDAPVAVPTPPAAPR